MSFTRAALLAVTFSAVTVCGAHATDFYPWTAGNNYLSPSRFYVDAGVADLIQNEGATIKEEGVTIPGATVSIKSQAAVQFDLGYFITRNIAISATGGVPPTAKVSAAGSLKGYGTIGKVSYGPSSLTVHYHFDGLGAFRPYVGAGAVFLPIFSHEDGLLTDLHVHGNTGVAVEAGANYMVDRHWGAFFDFKKTLLKTNATGNLLGAPASASIRLDTVVVSSGLTYRF